MTGTLYVVATPIGNLKDITLRALEVLREADLILAEDTRVTKKLLAHYKIQKPVLRYDEYSKTNAHEKIAAALKNGEKIALVTDAGTPGISDPGAKLVVFIQKELPQAKIVPIPGPSALIAALSVSGLNANQFTFLGYPPHKKGRNTFFAKLKDIKIKPIIIYESPHRFKKALESLKEVFGGEAEIVVARELTKIYEEIFRSSISEAMEHFQGERTRGEFVLIIQ